MTRWFVNQMRENFNNKGRKMTLECPRCRSKNIDQYRTPTGPIWCNDCGLEVDHKETFNPFVEDEEEHPSQSQPCEQNGREQYIYVKGW